MSACVRRSIEEYRFRGFKLHLRVGDLDPSDPLLGPAFEQVEAARLPFVIHSGSAPDGGRFTAPGPIRALLKRHPALPVAIAHMGAGEFGEYLEMAESWENFFLDTTMVFVDPMALGEFPLPLLSRLEGISHRILFGSDFPNIPYPLSHAVESVLALPLSGAAKRRILWENGRALFGLEGAGAPLLSRPGR